MHWFLEKVKTFYPLLVTQPICRPKHTCLAKTKTFDEAISFLMSLIEFGGVCYWDGQVPETVDIDSGFILTTSGTTGEPKQALYSFEQFLLKFKDVKPNPIKTIMVMGLDHIGGMDVFFSVISRGGKLIFPQEVTPVCICGLIEAERIEFISLSPTFLNLILLTGAHQIYDLSSLKTINFGAEVMPATLLNRLKTALPHIQFKQTFGTTESGTMFVERHPSDPLLIKIPNSKVIDSKLYVKSDHGMVGYLQHDFTLDSDGYFTTGDLVEEHEGYLKILGRESDSVNIGGEKVSLIEVEEILLNVPGVQDVRVYGEKHVITGNVLVAEVVWDSEQNCRTYIKEYLKHRVNKHKVPSRINVVPEVAYSKRLKKVRI